MPYLVMGYRQGTGGWTTVFYEPADSIANIETVPGRSCRGSYSIVTDAHGSWIDQYTGAQSCGLQKTDRWTFYRNSSYRLTFETANLSYGANYFNYVYIGPFLLRGYRDGSDYVGFKSSGDTWPNTYPNSIAGGTRSSYAQWEILYEPIDASTATLTVNENGSLFGTRTVTHSSAVLDASEWPTLRMDVNNDRHRVRNVLLESAAGI